jgi:hypothetical protein
MKKTILGSAMLSLIILGAVCTFVMLANMNPTQIIETRGSKGWETFALGEGNPGANAGGVLGIHVYTHQANPAVAYATNLTETIGALTLAYGDNLNAALTGNVPYATAFDIAIEGRANVSQAYNTTGSCWELSWCRTLITCANLGIGADTAMTLVEVANNTDYIWYISYINNGGAGYTITHGQQVNVTSLKLQAWY